MRTDRQGEAAGDGLLEGEQQRQANRGTPGASVVLAPANGSPGCARNQQNQQLHFVNGTPCQPSIASIFKSISRDSHLNALTCLLTDAFLFND